MGIREQIPSTINVPKLLKDIGREVRHAERFINYLNPPKPERESKRKRKKPVNKDFVDYSLFPKTTSQDVSDHSFLLMSKTISHLVIHFQFMPLHELPAPIPAQYPRQTPLKLTLPKLALYPYERNSVPPDFNSVPNNNHTVNLDRPWLDSPYDRPQETVAIHRGGTVLKFKLG